MRKLTKAHIEQIQAAERKVREVYTGLFQVFAERKIDDAPETMNQAVDLFDAMDAWADAYTYAPPKTMGGKRERIITREMERRLRASGHFTSGIALAYVWDVEAFIMTARPSFSHIYE